MLVLCLLVSLGLNFFFLWVQYKIGRVHVDEFAKIIVSVSDKAVQYNSVSASDRPSDEAMRKRNLETITRQKAESLKKKKAEENLIL
jgi:hypothetical protein